MSQRLLGTIEELKALLETKLTEVTYLKKTINMLAQQAGMPVVYDDVEDLAKLKNEKIRPDQYFGKKPTTAAREFLEKRNEATKTEDILTALIDGGFDFENLGWTKKLRLKNLAISLAKNSGIFQRLPNGTFGLLKWYPEIAKKKKATKEEAKNNSETEEEPPEEQNQEVDVINGEGEAPPPIEDDDIPF